MKQLNDTFPLTESEKEELLDVFATRFNYLGAVFVGGCFVMILLSFSGLYYTFTFQINELLFDGGDTWLISKDGTEGWVLKIIISIFISLIITIHNFYFHLVPIRSDALSGIKHMLPLK